MTINNHTPTMLTGTLADPTVGPRILEMLQMQCELNSHIRPEWRDGSVPFYRAVHMEISEAIEHYGWKWWKPQEPNMEMFYGELLDIWHFAMSSLLVQFTHMNLEDHVLHLSLAAHSGKEKRIEYGPPKRENVLYALENLGGQIAIKRGLGAEEVELFFDLVFGVGLSLEELYTRYLYKNVLNFFRRDFGYGGGYYQKQWKFSTIEDPGLVLEDNEILDRLRAIIPDTLDPVKYDIPLTIYRFLVRLYCTRENRSPGVAIKTVDKSELSSIGRRSMNIHHIEMLPGTPGISPCFIKAMFDLEAEIPVVVREQDIE